MKQGHACLLREEAGDGGAEDHQRSRIANNLIVYNINKTASNKKARKKECCKGVGGRGGGVVVVVRVIIGPW